MAPRRLDNRNTAGENARSWSTAGRIGIIQCLHILLWTALYITASTMYTLIVGAVTVKDIPSAVLLLVSSIVSVFYVALHNTTTRLNISARNLTQCERVDTLRSLAAFTLRIMATMWLIAAAISITITASRRALCELSVSSKLSDNLPLDNGTTCILNRVALLCSFVALLASGMLFVLLDRVSEPFRCHLFGIVEEHRLLPLFLPYHKTAKLAMKSEMSFKCRSSTSIEEEAVALPRSSSASLAVAPRNNSANLLPPNPKNALGLGIYTSKTSLPASILTPRPSMTTIRSQTVPYSAPHPPSSPLPPLPTYVPYKYQPPATPRNITNPPQRPARPTRTRSFMTVPITKPASALTKLHLAALNRNDSFSSIYSRSTSGESLPALSESGRTLTPSSSTSTLRGGTPLKAMTLAQDHVVSDRLSSWEVDDVAELEARISPVMRHSAKAGVMKGHVRDTWVESPTLPVRSKSLSPPRRKIRKVRESGREHNMF